MNEVQALPSFDVPNAKHMDRIVGRFQARVTCLMGSANGTGGTLVPASGQLIQQDRTASATGIIEVPTKGLASGIYTAGLFADGVQVALVKFEIIR